MWVNFFGLLPDKFPSTVLGMLKPTCEICLIGCAQCPELTIRDREEIAKLLEWFFTTQTLEELQKREIMPKNPKI